MSDRYLIDAFDQGLRAGERDRERRSNPFMPHTQREKFEAWNCGYDEAAPRYVAGAA